MVGRLEHFKNDPNGEGRGGGWYYHRGHQVWSKYDRSRDMKRSTKTTITRKQAGPKLGGTPGRYAHIGDTHQGNYRKGRYW